MPRLLDALVTAAKAAFPTYPFWVPRRYRVIRMSTNRVELQIVNKALGLPDLLPIAMAPGVSGAWSKLAPGSIVVVQFVDGDPSQPLVTHYAAKDEQGFVPVELLLDATTKVQVGPSAALVELGSGSALGAAPAGTVVRVGDVCTVGTATGAISVAGSYAKVKA